MVAGRSKREISVYIGPFADTEPSAVKRVPIRDRTFRRKTRLGVWAKTVHAPPNEFGGGTHDFFFLDSAHYLGRTGSDPSAVIAGEAIWESSDEMPQ